MTSVWLWVTFQDISILIIVSSSKGLCERFEAHTLFEGSHPIFALDFVFSKALKVQESCCLCYVCMGHMYVLCMYGAHVCMCGAHVGGRGQDRESVLAF